MVFLEKREGRKEEIQRLREAGVTDFVVAGGDGTVNEVAASLLYSSARLGILPSGSGNGLARDLGLPMEMERALEVIRAGRVRTIDAGSLNGKPFFCTAGIGFDAVCAHDFAGGKHARGFWNYVRVIFRNYFNYGSVLALADGEERAFFSLTFANAGQFGNNAYIAPDARPDDGYLDCAVILPHPKLYFAELSWRLVRKTLGAFPYFRTWRFKECVLTDLSDLCIHIDGEAVTLDTPRVEVKVMEKALNVVVPSD